MAMPRPQVGDDVFVHEPQRFEPGCVSITGPILSIDGPDCTVDAYVAFAGGGVRKRFHVLLAEVDRRLGTPISELSGRPGTDGFVAFKRIARSWGKP